MPKAVGIKKWIITVAIAIGIVLIFRVYYPSVAEPVVLYKYAAEDAGHDAYPSIAYGNGKWVVVWQSTDKLKKGVKPGNDTNIMFTSSKNGKTWDQPQLISKDPGLDGPSDTSPHITTDGKGNWLVVWVSTANISGSGSDSDILEIKSNDNALQWKGLSPLNLNAAADDATKPQYTSDLAPRVATDGQYWMVVWEGNSWAKSSEHPGCQETAPTTLWKPNDHRTYVQYKEDFTSAWKKLFCIQPSADNHYNTPTLAADSKGNWVIPFVSDTAAEQPGLGVPCAQMNLSKDDDILFVRTNHQQIKTINKVWGTCYPWNINSYADNDNDTDSYPALATNGKIWIAVWESRLQKLDVTDQTKNLGQDYDILVAMSQDGGKTWGPAIPLNTNAEKDSGHDLYPAIATNGSEWAVVWESNDDLGGTIGTDVDILLSTSKNGMQWSPPKALHTNADSDSEDDQRPQIATDGKEWVVVWHSKEDGGTGPDSDILVVNFPFPKP